jgi:DNA polymerase
VNHTSPTEELIRSYFSQTREMFGDNLFISMPESSSDRNSSLSLAEFEESISDCRKCDLWKERTNFVFGVGNPQAKLVLVGEAPGKEEDLQGKPFGGGLGNFWTKFWLPSISIGIKFIFAISLKAVHLKIEHHIRMK